MKRILLLAAAIMGLSSMPMSADTLTPEQALARLANADGPHKVRSLDGIRLVHTVTDTEALTPGCYIFDMPSDGYIIVSANDIATPLLGYAETGNFDSQNIPDNLAYWLDSYAREIAAASTDLSVTKYQPLAAGERPYRGAISPLCKTKWDQSSPYNLLCPKSGTSATAAGCTATAMAQIMKYHRWPEGKGTGSKSYRWGVKTISFDYGATTFDWDNMLDTYTTGGSYTTSDPTANAVATLVYACGIACSCNYGVSSTGGTQNHGLEVLKTNLGYAADARTVYRSLYNILDWEQLVYNQLRDYGPVWYTGYNPSYDGSMGTGHSFVCDGYSKDGYFHINWGWSGMADGYFRLSALEPENQGTGGSSAGYNYSQNIIINLCPDRGQSPKHFVGIFIDGDFSIDTKAHTLGTTCTFYPRAWSNSSRVIDSLYGGLRFVDAQGNETFAVSSTQITELKPNYGFSGQTAIKVTLPITLEDGTYTVYPGFRDDNDEWHDFQPALQYVSHLIGVVNDGLIRFSAPSTEFPGVDTPTVLSAVYSNRFFEADVKVTNNNSDEFFGNLVVGLLNDTKTEVVSAAEFIPVNLLPGETVSLRYLSKFRDIANGNYQLAVLGVYNGNYYLLSNSVPVTVTAVPSEQFDYTFTTPEIKGEVKDSTGTVETSYTLTCTEGADDIYVGLQFARSAFATAFNEQYQFDIPLSKGYSRDIHFKVPIEGVNTTTNYQARYFIRCNGTWTQFATRSFKFTIAGIEEIISDSAAIKSIATFDMQGRLVDNDNLAPGTYIRVITKDDGTTETIKIAH